MQDVLASIGVKKALPFTKFLNYELNKLRESGVLQNVLAIPKQTCPLDENLMPINFSKTIFLFTVFIVGGLISVIIFIFERVVSSNKEGKLERIDGKQCNAIKEGRVSTTEKIEIQWNNCQSVAIRTKKRRVTL